MARAFARAAHVLGEHVDAYANEGFLGTATQWDNLRKLVEMLGYHPAPPASASTLLVIEAKPNANGLLARGFPVKHSPPAGGAPVVFETLRDVVVDARLNALRHQGWDRSVRTFSPDGDGSTDNPPLWQLDEDMAISAGQPAVLLQQPTDDGLASVTARAEARTVATVDTETRALHLAPSPLAGNAVTWYRGYTRLLLEPKKAYRPRLNGAAMLMLDRDHGLTEGDLIAWQSNGWKFSVVMRTEGASLLLENDTATGSLYKLLQLTPVPNASGGLEYRAPVDFSVAAYRGTDGQVIELDVKQFEDVTEKGFNQNYKRLKNVEELRPPLKSLYIVRGPEAVAGQIVTRGSEGGQLVFNGSAGTLISNSWVVLEGPDATGQVVRRAARIASVTQRDDDFVLSLGESAAGAGISISTLARMPDDLVHRLRQVETALDQRAFNRITLRALVGGEIGRQLVVDIQGVGENGRGYDALLARAGIRTIRDLASVDLAAGVAGIGPVRLREFKAHAELLTGFRADAEALAPYLDQTLARLRRGPTSTTTRQTGKTVKASSGSGLTRVDLLHGPFRYSLRTIDGGYIITGLIEAPIGNTNLFLLKTDLNGNEEWSKTLGGSQYEEGSCVQQTADGGYIITGYTTATGAGDIWLVKTFDDGTIEWDFSFGGTANDIGHSVQQTSDGGYFIAGEYTDPDTQITDMYLIKTDTDGVEEWSDIIDNEGKEDVANYGIETNDLGYIIIGSTGVYADELVDIIVLKYQGTNQAPSEPSNPLPRRWCDRCSHRYRSELDWWRP